MRPNGEDVPYESERGSVVYTFSLEGDRPMQLIASDGGLLAAPREIRSLTLAPGERAQVIVDLSEGRPLRLIASSPDTD